MHTLFSLAKSQKETNMEIVKLSDNQSKELKLIVSAGKIDYKEIDGRAVRALSRLGFVKVTENSKGKFVIATAKGKKLS